MFTMKKLALISAAGLAALSISCSDGGDDETAGGSIAGLALGTASAGGIYDIKGTVTANEGSVVKGVTIAVTGGSAERLSNDTIPGVASVTLESLRYKLVPGECSGATITDVSVTVKVTATFDIDAPAEVTENFTVKCQPKVVVPTGFELTGNVTLGGENSATGSFLDIDFNPFKVYLRGEAAAVKDDIDLLFDGANFKTPSGATTGFGSEQLALSASVASLCVVPATVTINSVDDVIDFFTGETEDGDPVDPWCETSVTVAPVTAYGTYIVYTSKGNLALVKVQGDLTANVTLVIGRADIE